MQLQVEEFRLETTGAFKGFMRGGCRDAGERWRIHRREAVVAACGRSMASSLNARNSSAFQR
jgi:hypothetical protein